MRLTIFYTLLSLATFASAFSSTPCARAENTTTPEPELGLPQHFGVMLFPAFTAIDVYGPLEALSVLSYTYKNLTMSVMARTLDAVSSVPKSMNTTFGTSTVTTHTFDSPPSDLEVLIVPGGVGTRSPDLAPEIEFISTIYPKLRYIIGVCTGTSLLARSGVLDGRMATGNKKSWVWNTAQGNKTHWIAKARWVEDGNVWTTSGVTAGIDGTFGWVEKIFGKEKADDVAAGMEYTRVTDWRNDPWGEYYNLTDVLPTQ